MQGETEDRFKSLQSQYNIPLKGIALSKGRKFIYCWTTVGMLRDAKIKNWGCNRPPDKTRSLEIAEYVRAQQRVDGTVYLADVPHEEELTCYDGSHRLLAVRLLEGSESPTDIPVMVSIMTNASKGEIVDHFEVLNKCIPLPAVYHDGACAAKKMAVSRAVQHFVDGYPMFFKPSRSPNVPHENRDAFSDKLEALYEQYGLTSEDSIVVAVMSIDGKVRANIPKRASASAVEKCRKHGLYVFLNKFWDKVVVDF